MLRCYSLYPKKKKKKKKKKKEVYIGIESTPSPSHPHRGVRLFEERNDHWNECSSYNLNAYLK
jgi:hypothetical protein